MINSRLGSNVVEQDTPAEHAAAEFDPLSKYESSTIGKEFTAYLPQGDERRFHEGRRKEQLIKTWRGVPTMKGNRDSIAVRNGLSNMRDFETQRVIDNERMFVLVLAAMTVLLAIIFSYFVMNFRF